MAAAKAAKKGAPQRTLTQMAREAAAKPTGAVGAYRPARKPVFDEDEDAWGEDGDAWGQPADPAVSGQPSEGADGPVKLSDSGGSAGQPAVLALSKPRWAGYLYGDPYNKVGGFKV